MERLLFFYNQVILREIKMMLLFVATSDSSVSNISILVYKCIWMLMIKLGLLQSLLNLFCVGNTRANQMPESKSEFLYSCMKINIIY